VTVQVQNSQVTVGPNPNETTTYRKGQEFVCTEEEAVRMGNAVIIVEPTQEPKKISVVEKIVESKPTIPPVNQTLVKK
jgi:hypothetical protein